MPVQGRAGETRVLQDALDTGFLVSILRKDLRSDFQQLRPTRGRSLSLGGAIGQSRLHAPRSCCRPHREPQISPVNCPGQHYAATLGGTAQISSEEHPSELQSLMRISYAVFCLTKNIYK